MKTELRKIWKQSQERNENKVSILILPLFPNHELELKVKFAIDV